MLAEFKALRDEIVSSLNARTWGALTYLVAVAGIGTWYSKSTTPPVEATADAALAVIFVALPLLWHTILRERSRIRIGSYIKVVLEPQLDGLSWERCLQLWRSRIPTEDHRVRTADKWGHILSLTGVYSIVSVAGLVALLRQPAHVSQKLLGGIGILLLLLAHVALNRLYSSAWKYDEIFSVARPAGVRFEKAPNTALEPTRPSSTGT